MNRSAFTARIAGAAAAASLLPRVARADDPIRIGAGSIDPAAEPYYAQETGAWAKSGGNFVLQVLPNAGTIAAALIGGSLEIGLIDIVSMASAHLRGVPLTFIAPAGMSTNDHPSNGLMVTKASGIKTGKDFNGKTVATASLRNINQVVTESWITRTGGDVKLVKFIELPYGSMAPALRGGTIDAASAVEPWVTMSRAEFNVIPTTNSGLGDRYMVSAWAARTEWVKANPDAVHKFVTVIHSIALWANANPKLTEPMLAKYAKMDPELLKSVVRVQYGDRMDPALVQPLIDAGVRSGVLSAGFPASDIITVVR